ncbi:hypothetical protein ACS0TY_016246 [Phlomoides rotata]
MAKFLVYFLFLILIQSHLIVAMVSRKLGKHTLSPSEGPMGDENGDFATEVSATGGPGGEEEVMKINHHHRHHHPFDKSVAGGGVILGGLATTFLVAIVCYIRDTRRRSAEPDSPTNSDSSIGKKSGEPAKL